MALPAIQWATEWKKSAERRCLLAAGAERARDPVLCAWRARGPQALSGLAWPAVGAVIFCHATKVPASGGVEPVVAPSAPSASAPPCCTQGHKLVFATASQALQCDVCGASVAEGDMTWSCEPCDFDQCSTCAKAPA